MEFKRRIPKSPETLLYFSKEFSSITICQLHSKYPDIVLLYRKICHNSVVFYNTYAYCFLRFHCLFYKCCQKEQRLLRKKEDKYCCCFPLLFPDLIQSHSQLPLHPQHCTEFLQSCFNLCVCSFYNYLIFIRFYIGCNGSGSHVRLIS